MYDVYYTYMKNVVRKYKTREQETEPRSQSANKKLLRSFAPQRDKKDHDVLLSSGSFDVCAADDTYRGRDLRVIRMACHEKSGNLRFLKNDRCRE